MHKIKLGWSLKHAIPHTHIIICYITQCFPNFFKTRKLKAIFFLWKKIMLPTILYIRFVRQNVPFNHTLHILKFNYFTGTNLADHKCFIFGNTDTKYWLSYKNCTTKTKKFALSINFSFHNSILEIFDEIVVSLYHFHFIANLCTSQISGPFNFG